MLADRAWAVDGAQAEKFARLALACVEREYPNKIAHTLNSDADAGAPRTLTPAFYGCYDWHSAVHGHWLLARLAREFPQTGFAREALAALARNITPASMAGEVRYLSGKDRAGFERPYGLAWLLTLGGELRKSASPLAPLLQPLEEIAVERISAWLPKLNKPDRSGQHANTAFAMGMMLDWSRATGLREFEKLLLDQARAFYFDDRDGPLAWEPSGEDFLSPCLAEADLMRRVLDASAFSPWLYQFLPRFNSLTPVISTDPSDGKLAHADGLNLSRAWMLRRVAARLPGDHELTKLLFDLAETHAATGLAAVTGKHYEGGHWLATFAVYLLVGPRS